MVKYNAITKLETIDLDFDFLKKRLDIERLGHFVSGYSSSKFKIKDNDDHSYQEKHEIYTRKMLKQYEDVPTSMIRRIYKLYIWDFELFNYDIEVFLNRRYAKGDLAERDGRITFEI